jgi:hypothetical protein
MKCVIWEKETSGKIATTAPMEGMQPFAMGREHIVTVARLIM